MEITLQLCFVFVRHCNVFFITLHLSYLFVRCSYLFHSLELRYILVRSNYIWKFRYKMMILVTFVCNQNVTKKIRNYYVIC